MVFADQTKLRGCNTVHGSIDNGSAGVANARPATTVLLQSPYSKGCRALTAKDAVAAACTGSHIRLLVADATASIAALQPVHCRLQLTQARPATCNLANCSHCHIANPNEHWRPGCPGHPGFARRNAASLTWPSCCTAQPVVGANTKMGRHLVVAMSVHKEVGRPIHLKA